MVIRTVRAGAWMLAAAAVVFTLSGCNNASIGMKLVNDGAYPITEVLVYPVPADGAAPGPEAQVNRMPKDGAGSTIALLPNDQTMLPYLFRNEVYDVSVTFYDSKNQVFRQAKASNPVDLTGVKRGSLVLLNAAMNTNNVSTIGFEVNQ
jgi:hypothetical protein